MHFSADFISFVRARRTPGPSLPTVPQIAVRFPVFGQKSRSYARPFAPQMIGLSPGTRRRRLFLYILLAVSGYAGIHYLLFPSRKKGVPFHLFLRALNRPLPFRSHGAGQKSLPLLALGTSSSSGISAASSARRHSRFSRGSSYGNSSFPVSRSRSGVNRRS